MGARKAGRESVYLTLMYGRVMRADPPGSYDRLGGPVLGPFSAIRVEYLTRVTVEPGQTDMTVFANTGRFVTREQAAAALDELEEYDGDDFQSPSSRCVFSAARTPFRRATTLARLILEGAGGQLTMSGESIFYSGLWWAGFTVISSRVFDSDPSWTKEHQIFDAAKSVPPAG